MIKIRISIARIVLPLILFCIFSSPLSYIFSGGIFMKDFLNRHIPKRDRPALHPAQDDHKPEIKIRRRVGLSPHTHKAPQRIEEGREEQKLQMFPDRLE